MIDRATVDRIMDAAQIVDVVSDFVTLKRAGANYKGLCPFHDDRTPSFMVSPAKNYCKCFACGKGGNPVGFIMEHEQVSYPDALRYLARKYGITIEERQLTPEERVAQTDRESMFVVNQWAKEWFTSQLYDTDDGRAIGLAYFRQRGFRDDILKKFQVGYCPNRRDSPMSAAALKAGYQERYLAANPDTGVGTGLSFKREGSTQLRDRFFGRVIWPIFTVGGKVAGFGGRVLDAATKGVAIKYQNSPESIIYSKKRELFGLYQAKQAIVRQDLCYLVEGYTDVMAMHQSGVENVVASSGTALTDPQIALIHRFTQNITVIYDGDAAGIKASKRGIDMLLAQGLNVKLLLLPDGDDPDSFARKHNAEEFKTYLADHQVDFIKFKTSLVLQEAKGDPIQLSRMVGDIVGSIAVIRDEITRSLYIREIAEMMKMSERLIGDAVTKQIKQNLAKRTTSPTPAPAPHPAPAPDDIPVEALVPPEVLDAASAAPAKPANNRLYACEVLLIQAVIRHGEQPICEVEGGKVLTTAEFVAASLAQDDLHFATDLHTRILQEAEQHAHDADWKAEKYFLAHADPEVARLAFELSTDKEELSRIHGEQAREPAMDHVLHLLADFKLAIIEREKADIERDLRNARGPELRDLLVRFKRVKEIENALARQCGDRVIVR